MVSDFLEIMKKSSIPVEEYTDIAFALCESDMLFGDNRMESYIPRLVASVPEFHALQADSDFAKELPKVQVYRVLCDTAILSLMKRGNTFDDIKLTGGTSPVNAVADTIGVKGIGCYDYADEDTCEMVMKKLKESLVDESEFAWAVNLDKALCETHKYFSMMGYESIENACEMSFKDFALPVETKLFKKGSIEEDIRETVYDKLMSDLILLFLNEFKVIHDKNYVEAQVALYRASELFGDFKFGVYSTKNRCPRIEFLGGFPYYTQPVLKLLFSHDKPYTIDDLPYILYMLVSIKYKRSSVKKFDGAEVLDHIKGVFSYADK